MEAYELSKLQYDILQASSEADGTVFSAEPNPIGTLEERKKTLDELKLLTDMVDLGIMGDVRHENKEAQDKFIEQYGFGIRFFRITDQGKQMFNKKNLIVN